MFSKNFHFSVAFVFSLKLKGNYRTLETNRIRRSNGVESEKSKHDVSFEERIAHETNEGKSLGELSKRREDSEESEHAKSLSESTAESPSVESVLNIQNDSEQTLDKQMLSTRAGDKSFAYYDGFPVYCGVFPNEYRWRSCESPVHEQLFDLYQKMTGEQFEGTITEFREWVKSNVRYVFLLVCDA